jgi:hypothetical protein
VKVTLLKIVGLFRVELNLKVSYFGFWLNVWCLGCDFGVDVEKFIIGGLTSKGLV